MHSKKKKNLFQKTKRRIRKCIKSIWKSKTIIEIYNSGQHDVEKLDVITLRLPLPITTVININICGVHFLRVSYKI